MVHCVSSSEPDSGDVPVASEDWRIQGITTKEITLSQPGLHGKTYVESTVTTGIKVGTQVDQVNSHLTLTDMHQPADTTHDENTYADSQEHMDTSSPNHSIYSDTMDQSPSEDQLATATKDNMTDFSYREVEVNTLPVVGHGHYQPILYHDQQYVPNTNVYRQQTLVPDHAHCSSMLPQKFETKSCAVAEPNDPQQNSQRVADQHDNMHQNSTDDKQLEGESLGIPYCPDGCESYQKFVNIGIAAPSGLYPHLYNYRSDPNSIAVVNYSPNKQAYINPYIYNQFVYAQEGDDGEGDTDSSSED